MNSFLIYFGIYAILGYISAGFFSYLGMRIDETKMPISFFYFSILIWPVITLILLFEFIPKFAKKLFLYCLNKSVNYIVNNFSNSLSVIEKALKFIVVFLVKPFGRFIDFNH